MTPISTAQAVEIHDGLLIPYLEQGDRDGVPLILLHGLTDSHRSYEPVLEALPSSIRAIALTARGHGDAGKPEAGYDADQMAADVIAVLDKLAIERASVVGWSDGGEIALKLGIGFADRVDRLFVFAANYDANGSKSRSTPSTTFAAYSAKCRSDYERLAKSGIPYNGLIDALLPLWRGPSAIITGALIERS